MNKQLSPRATRGALSLIMGAIVFFGAFMLHWMFGTSLILIFFTPFVILPLAGVLFISCGVYLLVTKGA